jgi:hypothetical protein
VPQPTSEPSGDLQRVEQRPKRSVIRCEPMASGDAHDVILGGRHPGHVHPAWIASRGVILTLSLSTPTEPLHLLSRRHPSLRPPPLNRCRHSPRSATPFSWPSTSQQRSPCLASHAAAAVSTTAALPATAVASTVPVVSIAAAPTTAVYATATASATVAVPFRVGDIAFPDTWLPQHPYAAPFTLLKKVGENTLFSTSRLTGGCICVSTSHVSSPAGWIRLANLRQRHHFALPLLQPPNTRSSQSSSAGASRCKASSTQRSSGWVLRYLVKWVGNLGLQVVRKGVGSAGCG